MLEAGSVTWPWMPREDWTLVIAVVALFQKPIGWAIRRTFLRSSIAIEPTGQVEVGYSAAGPSVHLLGSMISKRGDSFVRMIGLSVTRRSDGMTHAFRWRFFREQQMSSTDGQQTTLRLPAAFVVRESDSYSYNIVFIDEETQAKLQSALVPLQTAWQKKLAGLLFPDSTPEQQAAARKAAYETFSKDPAHAQAVHLIDRMMYWEPGTYVITAQIEIGRRRLKYQWQFSLGHDHCVLLQVNTMTAIQQVIGVNAQPTNVVYAPYESVT